MMTGRWNAAIILCLKLRHEKNWKAGLADSMMSIMGGLAVAVVD